ncbi:MAG: dynamin family protein [Betaproteobacteria bacterium]|nr:dynamin family protein [Rhodocyclaceae bacterium]MCA3134248.1 dynamin family protein [Rhodocyclaceae bacterium]MCA3142155.1 dynamin family protein [Rhodocyclaceae bacterium]MCA3146788.1 dynamin family protein [Rhodocyclaceae bacterium]MCE2898374.1 dynamin family protein [Betaproteobacteria bacterium]
MTSPLEHLVARYSQWREQLRSGIEDFHAWLDAHGHVDIQRSLRLYELAESLRSDRMVLAFLAEFSRGKTELINAIFFSDYQRRLLPSDVGRTTMCPAEIFHDGAEEPYIRLLPIETRRSDETISALKYRPIEWVKIKLQMDNPEELQKALSALTECKSVSLEEADALGLLPEGGAFTSTVASARLSRVEIPAWRHALINFPHPLLKSGLVILDTPGLNALGTEPELTVSMIPNAHAVLFLLAVDTGVTKSDLDVWNQFVRGRVARSIAVLNKIDLMWDELKSDAQIEVNLQRQIDETADILELPRGHVIALSAQKALVARVRKDPALLQKSRIAELERVLAEEIVPAKQAILRASVQRDIGAILDASFEGVRSAHGAIVDELRELSQLSGKNRELAKLMLARLEQDKVAYQRNLDSFRANYGTVLRQGHELLASLDDSELETLMSDSRKIIEASWTTNGLMRSMRALFDQFEQRSNRLIGFSSQTSEFVQGVYQLFHEKHRFPKLSPPALNLEKHFLRVAQLKTATQNFCADPVNIMNPKFLVVRKFYDQLASEARWAFLRVRTDFEAWLGSSLVPLSNQLREHHKLLERRVEGIRKISDDVGALQERAKSLEGQRETLARQLDELLVIKSKVAGTAAEPS